MQIRALLVGDATRVPAEPWPDAVAKTLVFVLDLGRERDVRIVPSAVEVRALGWGKPQRYFGAAGPHVLRRLMNALHVKEARAPIVGSVPPQRTYGHLALRQLAWLVPLSNGIEVRFRPSPSDAHGAPQPIPADGPLALPEPVVRWVAPAYADHAEGLPCPYCAVVARRHRTIRGTRALVCATCGRSFVP